MDPGVDNEHLIPPSRVKFNFKMSCPLNNLITFCNFTIIKKKKISYSVNHSLPLLFCASYANLACYV